MNWNANLYPVLRLPLPTRLMIYLELLAIILNVFRITSTGPECCASFVEMRNFAVVALKPTGSRSLNRHFETAKLG